MNIMSINIKIKNKENNLIKNRINNIICLFDYI